MLSNFFVPILDDGWRFIAIFALITFLAALTGLAWLFWPLMVLTLWSIYFFRDPPRGVPQDDGVLIAPADGLVQMVAEAVPPSELGLGDLPLKRVSIFLSVFEVHINRSPAATACPGLIVQTMRRATQPAICTQPTTRPSARRNAIPMRSLSSLAFSALALRNLPGR